ncbi:hypothetical protein PUN28_012605 [Cardiocondyla obscurior]|uniref:Uncharacterized protein n=1 Tax=Cardiocondyla obscurior TaxID=286306 RepID=A0AAW2FG44_9HYME
MPLDILLLSIWVTQRRQTLECRVRYRLIRRDECARRGQVHTRNIFPFGTRSALDGERPRNGATRLPRSFSDLVGGLFRAIRGAI